MKKLNTRLFSFFFLVFIIIFPNLSQSFEVTLEWDPNPVGDNALGYKLYHRISFSPYNNTDVVDVGNQTRYTLSGLPDGYNYYFAVTAYNANGESGKSAEVSAYGASNLLKKSLTTSTEQSTFSISAVLWLNDNLTSYTGEAKSYSWTFGEEVIVKAGYFSPYSNYKDFVVVGKNTKSVWLIRNHTDASQYSGQVTYGVFEAPSIWLSNAGMSNISDIFVLNYDKASTEDSGDDIAIVDYINGQMRVYKNIGFAFDETPTITRTFTAGAFSRGTTGDFDGNTNEDILLRSPTTQNSVVWKSDGTTFLAPTIWASIGTQYSVPFGLDFDGNGLDDLLLVNFKDGAFYPMKSNGSVFTNTDSSVQTFTPAAFGNLLVGDFIDGSGEEFGLHSVDGEFTNPAKVTGNLVMFTYSPSTKLFNVAPTPVWLNSTSQIE